MIETYHPLIKSPRRIYWRDDGHVGYIIVGGIQYPEDGCRCGKTGTAYAAAYASHEMSIPVALRKVELLEKAHGVTG